MTLKKVIGLMLMVLMVLIAYGLFGVGTIEHSKPMELSQPANISYENVTQIDEYHYYTTEEQISTDIGCIGLILSLIVLTSLGTFTGKDAFKILPEKGSDTEIDGDELDE